MHVGTAEWRKRGVVDGRLESILPGAAVRVILIRPLWGQSQRKLVFQRQAFNLAKQFLWGVEPVSGDSPYSQDVELSTGRFRAGTIGQQHLILDKMDGGVVVSAAEIVFDLFVIQPGLAFVAADGADQRLATAFRIDRESPGMVVPHRQEVAATSRCAAGNIR